MRLSRRLALGASVLALALSACSTGGGGASPGTSGATSGATIKIGSDGFDEARVVAEVYAQALEAAGFKVDRALHRRADRGSSLPPPSRAARSTSSPSTSAPGSSSTAARRPEL